MVCPGDIARWGDANVTSYSVEIYYIIIYVTFIFLFLYIFYYYVYISYKRNEHKNHKNEYITTHYSKRSERFQRTPRTSDAFDSSIDGGALPGQPLKRH